MDYLCPHFVCTFPDSQLQFLRSRLIHWSSKDPFFEKLRQETAKESAKVPLVLQRKISPGAGA